METRNPSSAANIGPGGDAGTDTRPEGRTGPPPGSAANDPQRTQEQMKSAGESAADAARSGAREARDKAGEAAQRAKSATAQAAEQTRRKAAEYAQQARQRGQEMLDQQKHKAAEQLETVSAAAHRAASKFREDHDDNIAGYVDAMADEVERCANYLRQRDLGSLVREAQDFGRRRPEWLLGGMFVAGLALTRFLKSSAHRGPSARQGDDRSASAPGAASPRPATPTSPTSMPPQPRTTMPPATPIVPPSPTSTQPEVH